MVSEEREWHARWDEEDGARFLVVEGPGASGGAGVAWIPEAEVNELIATALHDQPGGLTWEDVDALETAASSLEFAEDADPFTYQEAGRLQGVAARIAALLSPRPDDD